MFDQATTLRQLMTTLRREQEQTRHPVAAAGPVPHVLAVTGGKGGVGKTLTTANLGLCFARMGMRTLLIDGDNGLANLDVVLNVRANHTIDDVLAGERSLKDIILTGPENVRIVPAASGVLKAPELSRMQRLALLDQVESLDEDFDVVLIDTPAGASKNVQYWTASAAEVIVVVTPEPTALSDGYALMKILSQSTRESRFKLVVNMARNDEEGLRVYDRLATLADEHLKVSIEYLGTIPFDEMMRTSVRERTACVQRFPFSPSARGLRAIATQILSEPPTRTAKGTVQMFWRRMIASGQNEILV